MTVWRGRASKGESVSHQVAAWSSLIGVVASLLVMVQVVSAPQALAAGANPYQNAVLANDPVMYVPFDQYGAVPQDSNTFNIAPGGTPGGASMTGSFTRYEPGALLSSPTAPSVGLSGGNATMLGTDGWHNSQVSFELWFKTTAGPTGSTQPLLFDQSANNGGFVQLSIDGSGLLVGTVNTAIDPYNLGDRQNLSVAGSQVADGAWHHAVFEVQQSAVTDIQLYIDGTPVPVQTTARQIVWLVGNNSASNGYVGGNGFSGWVDEFAVYKHALSLSQVRGDYAASGRTPPPLSLVGGPLVSTEMRSPSNDTPVCDCAKPITLPFGTFHHEWTDFAIPGRGAALSLQHTYTTALASSDGPLGYGWDFSYDAKLSVDPGTQAVTVAEGGGTAVKFTLQPTGGYLPAAPRTFASLTHNGDGSWTMVRQGTETLSFNSTGQLAQIMDRNQFATRLAYDGNGHLSTVTDPANRTLTFTWTGTHITAVSDPSTPARTVAFGYDGAGNLTDYTDVAVGNWHYTYDPSHRLLTMRDPRQVNANPPVAVSNVYDGQGRVTSQTDQLNRTTGFDYTTVPGAVIVTDPQLNKTLKQFSTDNVLTDETRGYGTPVAATWHYTYDPASAEVETVTDPNQHVTSFVYDDKGNRVRSSDPLGRTATAVFNSFNEPLKTTDGNGVTTTNVYDGYGNLTSTATPLDLNNTRTTTYTYDADPTRRSDVISMVDPNQKTWSYHYNANGDRDAVTDPLGNKTTTTFNNVGWPLSTVSPRGNVTGGNPALFTTTFDAYTAFGDLKHTTDPLGHTSAKDYDANRNVSSTTDSDNNTTTYVYDAENQQTEIHRADTSVLYTSYRADGRLQTQTDAAGHHTDYDYDAQGRLSTVTDPLGAVTTYGYDAVGNQTQQQDPGGNCGTNLQCTTMGYDADNELTSITYSDGVTPNVSSIGYDNNGRKTFAVDSFGTSSWGYDALGRLI